jgi:ariadne-1
MFCFHSLTAWSRYVELERGHIAENTPGWRWCLAPGCLSGQIHKSSASDEGLPGSKENPIELSEAKGSSWTGWMRRSIRNAVDGQKDKAPDTNPTLVLRPRAPDICTCKDCGAKACVPCDRPWHENETCEEYQFRTKDRLDEEDKSLDAIRKLSKRCPNCSKSIEKNGGCRHMLCTQCRTEFCWLCGQMINRNGRYCGCDTIPVQ